MNDQTGFAALLQEIKATRETIERADTDRAGVLNNIKAEQDTFRTALDDLYKRTGRLGFGSEFSAEAERKAAIGLLQLKHDLKIPKRDPQHPFVANEGDITEAKNAIDAIRALMHTTDISSLPDVYRKSLSSFSFGGSGFILPPTMSDRILSCLTDQTDVTSLFDSVNISGASVRFLIDNGTIDHAAWGCETSCFANNPNGTDLTQGLGELEIKPEPLRYIACATSDLLEDAGINIEMWLLNKVARAFRQTISSAVMTGDGVGKPLGILNPRGGIPVCDTAPGTPADQFTWQDLVMLAFQVPQQYWSAQSTGYLMNQNTAGLLFTMSDAAGRPIMLQSPSNPVQWTLLGWPVRIATQMPDVAPGATPIAFGNWRETYMIANRKAITMQSDPYSAGFCHLFKFESRVGGAVVCPNAARLLRIK